MPVEQGDSDNCADGLLWIGHTYPDILCRSARNCAIPTGARCFVHEAEWRGISRKVPHAPKWAVSGKTRIFLVHRGEASAADRGKIFGYLVLWRVEVLSRFPHPAPSPDVEAFPWSGPTGQGKLSVMVYDAATGRPMRAVQARATAAQRLPVDATVQPTGRHAFVLPADRYDLEVSLPGFEPSCAPGIEVKSGTRRNLGLYLKPQKIRPKVIREKCWDGSEIVTHRFRNGGWHHTKEECPEVPEPPECVDGEVVWQFCPNGQPIPEKLCIGGEWVDTGLECQPSPRQPPSAGDGKNGDEVPIDDEVFAQHRSCSLRLRPGACISSTRSAPRSPRPSPER